MDEIILLGMRSQVEIRNNILLESLTILSDIVSTPIARIINQYVYGDDQYIHPDTADAFWDGSYTVHRYDINLTISAVSESECCHSCCESGPMLKINISLTSWIDNINFPLICMWNYILHAYDDDMIGCIADRIADGYQTSACNANKYAKCMEFARELLDDIRQQIITAGNR